MGKEKRARDESQPDSTSPSPKKPRVASPTEIWLQGAMEFLHWTALAFLGYLPLLMGLCQAECQEWCEKPVVVVRVCGRNRGLVQSVNGFNLLTEGGFLSWFFSVVKDTHPESIYTVSLPGAAASNGRIYLMTFDPENRLSTFSPKFIARDGVTVDFSLLPKWNKGVKSKLDRVWFEAHSPIDVPVDKAEAFLRGTEAEIARPTVNDVSLGAQIGSLRLDWIEDEGSEVAEVKMDVDATEPKALRVANALEVGQRAKVLIHGGSKIRFSWLIPCDCCCSFAHRTNDCDHFQQVSPVKGWADLSKEKLAPKVKAAESSEEEEEEAAPAPKKKQKKQALEGKNTNTHGPSGSGGRKGKAKKP